MVPGAPGPGSTHLVQSHPLECGPACAYDRKALPQSGYPSVDPVLMKREAAQGRPDLIRRALTRETRPLRKTVSCCL